MKNSILLKNNQAYAQRKDMEEKIKELDEEVIYSILRLKLYA